MLQLSTFHVSSRIVAIMNESPLSFLNSPLDLAGGKHYQKITISPGAKMGTWKCLRVQGFIIDPESIGVLKEIKLGCHDGNLGELFLFAD